MNIRSSKLLYDNGTKMDKSDWESYNIGNSNSIYDFCYRNNYFYAFGGHKVYRSSECINWTAYDLTNTNYILKKIVDLSNSLFILCEYNANNSSTGFNINSYIPTVYYSDIGTRTYSATKFSTTGNWANCIFKDISSMRYMVGYKTVSGQTVGVISSWDSSSFNFTTPEILNCGGLNSIISIGSGLGIQNVAVGQNGCVVSRFSTIGTWDINIVGGENINWYSIAYGNGRYVIASEDGYTSMSKDLENWTTPIQTCGVTYPKMVFAQNKFFMVGTNGYSNSSYFGTDWNCLNVVNSSISPNQMWCIDYQNGKVLAGTYGRYIHYKDWKEL